MRHLAPLPFGFALYLAFAGALGAEQLISAAVMAIVTLGGATLLRRAANRPIRLSWRHAAPWLRAVGRVPADTARIGGVLLKTAIVGGSPGRGVTQAFHFGVMDDPEDRGRRATAVLAGSLTPDTFVLHIEPGQDTAVCHKLLSSSAPDRPNWLA